MQIDTKAIRLLQTTESHTLLFVNYFHATDLDPNVRTGDPAEIETTPI